MMKSDGYKLPGDNTATFSKKLASEIRKRFRSDRDNRFKLYLLSAGIRRKYLNPKTKTYAQDFQNWFKESHVDELFGSLSNFTRYAAAGDVIDYVASNTNTPEKYLAQLPTSLRSLYEISKILKMDQEVFPVCFHFTPTRKRVGDPKSEWKTRDTTSLFHSHCSSVKLAAWRANWEEPKTKSKEDEFRRNVKLLTVRVSQDIFDFDEVGNKTGAVDIEAVQSLLAQIEALFSDANKQKFKLETDFDRIKDKYKAEQQKRDPATVLKTSKKSRADDYQ